ncbi:MAG: DUF1549 domain-containing protein, partial [Planctomycetes bacterium]|nr:DUF1549 domain-containing protein [Planctomycetota bacterium]
DEPPATARHWAYVPPRRPELPAVRRPTWPQNSIDYFTLAEMEHRGLTPSPEQPRERLFRRLKLDLTGLPPTIAEVDAFLADSRPDAYLRAVDRSLACSQFGEHHAVMWLDLARYADTHGYHTDGHRDMWRWRDWVIEALNHNMPFDQFTVEQIAGDLLPGATLSQKAASGFNRNHMINFEDGAIPEQYRTEYVADRVETTATVWLAQTIGCARCHDHFYDPFSQREYFGLFAFFNNVPEQGLDGRQGNAPPRMADPTRLQQQQLDDLDRTGAELQEKLIRRSADSRAAFAAWEARASREADSAAEPADPILRLGFEDPFPPESSGDDPEPSCRIIGTPLQLRGKSGKGLLLDGESGWVMAGPPDVESSSAMSCGVWLLPTTDDTMAVIGGNAGAASKCNWVIGLSDGRPTLQMFGPRPDRILEVRAQQPLMLRRWQHLAVVCDGSGRAAGVAIYVDGRRQRVETVSDRLVEPIDLPRNWILGKQPAVTGFRGMIDEVRAYSRTLSDDEVRRLAEGDPIQSILAIPADQRSSEQRDHLRKYYLESHDAAYHNWQQQWAM